MISQVGAWSLDHPSQPVVYSKVFPEYWAKLEKHYYETQKGLLTKMHNALVVGGTQTSGEIRASGEGAALAKQTLENMTARFNYCKDCATEVITFLMKKRY